MLVNKKKRHHWDGSSVPQRSEGLRKDEGTVPCGLAS
jgi:hypothetical protein